MARKRYNRKEYKPCVCPESYSHDDHRWSKAIGTHVKMWQASERFIWVVIDGKTYAPAWEYRYEEQEIDDRA